MGRLTDSVPPLASHLLEYTAQNFILNTYHKYKRVSRSQGNMENNNGHIYHSNNNILDSFLRKLIELSKGERLPHQQLHELVSKYPPKRKQQEQLKDYAVHKESIFQFCTLQYTKINTAQREHTEPGNSQKSIKQKISKNLPVREKCMRHDNFPPTSSNVTRQHTKKIMVEKSSVHRPLSSSNLQTINISRLSKELKLTPD